jgi:cyclopropane fatty-acyl-phospholipid synthase-like methyltransferase
MKQWFCVLSFVALFGGQCALAQQPATKPSRGPDVIYVPTPPGVVENMLKLAKVTKNDVVYDLGCGDGRIVIEAAKRYGVRAVGIDIDPQRIAEARANAKKAGVEKLVEFRQADLLEADLREATVVTLYLLPSLNVKLMPKLQKELRKGARIVSHDFDMGEWKPDQELLVNGRNVYLWLVK